MKQVFYDKTVAQSSEKGNVLAFSARELIVALLIRFGVKSTIPLIILSAAKNLGLDNINNFEIAASHKVLLAMTLWSFYRAKISEIFVISGA